MDDYNPLYNDYRDGKIKDIQLTLNEQNQIYGAQHWYPLLPGVTPESYLFELTDDHIKSLSDGEIPTDDNFKKSVDDLISQGYLFVKTTHKSAHAFAPIANFQDFENQILNANIIMSFRRYKCRYLLFRKWVEMNLECRVYVYHKKVKYAEVYRDEKDEFIPSMFNDIVKFVTDIVIPKLTIYDDFTADVYFTGDGWGVVEINSPFWLKCGVYLVDYNYAKHTIHETTTPICKYTDKETDDVLDFELTKN